MDAEDKEVLAKFMGWEYNEQSETYMTPIAVCTSDVEPWCSTEEDWSCILAPHEMPFDTDWKWIMRVIDKIESMCIPGSLNAFRVVIEPDRCKVTANLGKTGEAYTFAIKVQPYTRPIPKLDLVGAVLVEFVEFYNKQWSTGSVWD